MKYYIALVALLLFQDSLHGTDQIAEQKSYVALHQSFRDRQDIDGDTDLVVDPRERTMWLEKDGRVIKSEVQRLPSGMRWTAFHQTQNGLAEISFPVRIDRPRNDVDDDGESESIYIIGVGKKRTMNMIFSATLNGNAFNVGFCSGVRSMQLNLPNKDVTNSNAEARMMLLPNTPHKLKYLESLELLGIPIRIIRDK